MSRKRTALEQLSPTKVKRATSRASRSRTAQAANKAVDCDENYANLVNKTSQKPSGHPPKYPATRARTLLSPLQKPMDVETPEPSKYSFETCPYAAEIYQAQLETEMKFFLSIGQGIKWEGRSISSVMRAILVNWLIEVAQEYKLRKETLFNAINYADRFLQKHENIQRNFLQLIGITCILIAAKYEEIEVPRVDELVYITDSTYDSKQILETEKIILDDLDYDLTVSTIVTFLPLYVEVAKITDEVIHWHTQLLADLSLTCYNLHAQFPPSLLAASIVVLSRHTYGETDLWSEEFLTFTRKTQQEIQRCAREILISYTKIFNSSSRPIAVIEKYRQPKYCRVGCRSPPQTSP